MFQTTNQFKIWEKNHGWLVVSIILKNMKVNGKDYLSPIYEMENKSHVWNHQ